MKPGNAGRRAVWRAVWRAGGDRGQSGSPTWSGALTWSGAEGEEGSLSLFAALLLVALLSLHLILVQAAYAQLAQFRARQFMDQAPDFYLGDYDAELYERLGLRGLRETDLKERDEELKKGRFWRSLDGYQGHEVQAAGQLLNREGLAPQIRSFMRGRLPLSFLPFLRSLRAREKQLGETGALAKLEELRSGSLREDLDRVRRQLGGAEASAAERGEEVAEKPPGGPEEQELSADERWTSLRYLGSLPSVEVLEQVASWDLSSSLESLSSVADHALGSEAGPAVEQLMVSEFALRSFPAQVHCRLGAKSSYPYQLSLRGQQLRDLPFKAPASVEAGLSGLEDEAGQTRYVRSRITALRLVVRVGEILSSRLERRLLRVLAGGCSWAVWIGSAFSINVPSELIYWGLVFGLAYIRARGDYGRLVAGESLSLLAYKGEEKLSSHYHDYLRLLFLLQSKEQLYARLGRVIAAEFPHSYCRGIRLELRWKNPFLPRQLRSEQQLRLQRDYAVYKTGD